jgi:hypothetical protein
MAVGDFPINPELKERIGRRPPEGHPGRCQSKRCNGSGHQCGQWAMHGHPYCVFHARLGRPPKYLKKGTGSVGIYDRYAKTTLLEAIRAMESDAPKREALDSEVDIARALTAESVKVTSAVLDPANSSKISNELKDNAIRLTMESLDFVSKLVERMVKVRTLSSATLSLRQVEDVCGSIIKLLRKKIDNEALVNELVSDILTMTIPGKELPRVSITID